MDMELDPRVKPLPYKVKATSRESAAGKGGNILDPDLRTHWSTGTNTKEWILLELDEACLLSNVRIYNKSVLEWEITVGLRYKPEAFVKVRPRCEAPKRDMSYPTNYTPCRYVRLSCLRGNPIAVYFIQLIGVTVKGLEPELQPVINYLLPHILSHKQDAHDMHLQLLENIASRLLVFLPQLETELSTFTDASDSNIRFLAMLVGPFYPILQIVNEREAVKGSAICPDSEMSRNNQPSIITVSSNFEVQPRRLRNQSLFMQSCSCPLAFGSDAAILLLRKASKDLPLGIVCRAAARALHKIIGPIIPLAHPIHITESALSSMSDETTASAMPIHADITDYSVLFGKEFEVANESWNANLVNVLDIASVEEGILHVLYACASHPLLCNRLAESNLDFWSILPLIQALLPALRPPIICLDRVDESFGQWKHPSVEQALSQIVILSSSPIYHPLLHACAGYLASYSSSHAKSACVLVDLCTGLFSPWISTVTAKVDLAIEFMEDLLGIIQVSHQSITRVRIALKCILLGLSGQIDDVLAKYKEHKRKLLFLIEMLEPFLDPVIFSVNNTTPFGGASPISLVKQENNCFFALNIIREAVRRPTILPSLESEWRRGSVASSVILSILGPNMPLPSDIDLFKCSTTKVAESGISIYSNASVSKLSTSSDVDGKIDGINNVIKFDVLEEAGLLFAPQELKNTLFTNFTDHCMGDIPGRCCEPTNGGNEDKNKTTLISMNNFQLDSSLFSDYFNLKLNYLKLTNLHECELRAAAFQQLALGLSSQCDITAEGYDAAVDAFILAAECFINPFFMISFTPNSKLCKQLKLVKSMINQSSSIMELKKDFLKTVAELEIISHLERKRDKIVLEILIQAAKVNKESRLGHSNSCSGDIEHSKQSISTLPHDTKDIDAVTLLRLNQNLLFEFVIQQLQREHHLSHEVLLQALLFLLQSATELLCPPEFIIDIILLSAESLSMLLMSQYNKHEKGVTQFDLEKLHGLQRFWLLLERIVEASSGSDVKSGRASYGFQCHSLIPLSSWINKISKFSNASPIARFLGWMAVSRYAEQYRKERLFFASDLSQLTLLLTIFADELTFVDDSLQLKVEEEISFKQADTFAQLERESTHSHASDQDDSFYILYPSMHKFFPNMRRKFRTFGETILEAIGLQLKCLPSNAIPEILRWFSDLCMCPYAEAMKIRDLASLNSFDCIKGYTATNAKVIVLYILESLVTVHIESMLPEMARVAQILISLCKTSYCDVAFMESVLNLLKPFISFFLKKAALNEKLLADALPCEDFELNFDALFDSIKHKRELQNRSGVNRFQGSLMIFILGDLFLDLSLKRKIDILESLCLWTGFTSSELTSSFPNYLCAFKKIFDSCEMLLEGQLKSFGFVIPCKEQEVMVSLIDKTELSHDSSGYGDQRHSTKPAKDFISSESFIDVPDRELYLFSIEEMKECSEVLERLILKLIPEIEKCWKLHSKFVNELTLKIAQCFLFSRCLKFIGLSGSVISSSNDGTTPYASPRDLPYIWDNGLQDLAKTLLEFQEIDCWHTTSVMLDYLFGLPQSISLDSCISNICSLIKQFCVCAPMISWRLQTDKWLTYLFMRGIGNVDVLKDSLIDLLGTMLSHGEPEQRAVALHHLGVMVGLDTYDRAAMLSLTFHSNLGGSEPATLLSEAVISTLVSNTWDRVASLILSEPSIMLRSHAMALLSSYVPFVTRSQLQLFLVSSSNILQGFERFSPILEGHLTRLSLGLLASACLYSPSEDITLIPEGIWKTLEHMGTSRTGWLDDVEKSVCLALCKLQTEFVDGKEALKEALIQTSTTKSSDYNFKNIRESILQVLPCLTSTRAYFEFFSKKADKESQELEEAEIEIELLQKEKAMQEVLGGSKNLLNHKDDNRIQQIKDNIRFLERSKLKEEVAERMLKKLAMRRNRKKALDEIALQEMKLLEELDRDRKNEQEQEIERQRQLELERARTRELQFNLDMERERQSQRELQRELELVESGVRSSRREFSSNSSSRPREKFREREAGRSGLEGSLRPGIKGQENCNGIQTSNCSLSLSPTVVLSGSRPFLGQPPTILQSKERPAERGSIAYEDSLEGSRDSGDANSAGDPELSLAFDGPSGGFGSTSRRGSKSRQVVERRDREARREGKWERKHA